MTILLPIEIKVRILPKIFLASKLLDKTKFDIVIEKNKVYNLFKHNKGFTFGLRWSKIKI